MQNKIDSAAAQSPFLVRYAQQRTQSPEIEGYYSHDLEMWVVSDEGVEVPLVNCARDIAELETKTKVQQESDDEPNLAELVTKTDSQFEQDDASFCAVLEMATKTEAQLEHDDTSPQVRGLFL